MGVYKTEGGLPSGRIDASRVDATTEADIKRHIYEDDQAALSDAGDYARRIRKRLGLTCRSIRSGTGSKASAFPLDRPRRC
jgi:putative transcriptional regulator